MSGRITNPWGILALLFLINMLNFFDRTIPAVLNEMIRMEWNLTDTDMGVVGTVFTLVYAFAGIPLGRMADTSSRITMLSWGVALWSAFTGATAWAWNYFSFFGIRIGVGIGEATCAPAATSLIADLFGSEKRAKAMGIFMLGLPIGIGLAQGVVGPLAKATNDWRMPFIYAAIPGFIIAVIVLMCLEPARGSKEEVNHGEQKSIEKPFRLLFAIPTFWWIIGAGATVNFAAYAVGQFLNAMMQRYYALDVAQASSKAAVILGLTGLVGLIVGGIVVDKVQQVRRNGRLLFSAICLAIAVPCTYLALETPQGGDMNSFTLLFAVGWLMVYVYYVSTYTALQEVVEPQLRATAMAVFFAAFYLLGAGFGTVVTGIVSDKMATAAMVAAGATEMTEQFRAVGLHSAFYMVPVVLGLCAFCLFMGSRTVVSDMDKMAERMKANRV